MFKYLIFLLIPLQAFTAEVFTQQCRAIGVDYLQFSIETGISQNNSTNKINLILKVKAFEDEKCQIPYLLFSQYFLLTGLDQNKVDLKTEKVTYTSLTDEVSEALRLIHYCDETNWKTNLETSVTGKICDDYQQLSKDDPYYQIIEINGSNLRFGETNGPLDGRSPNKRPVDFDKIEYIQNN